MGAAAEFDRYVAENEIPDDELGEAFADWLAQQTGAPVIGGPAGEPPSVVALPDDE